MGQLRIVLPLAVVAIAQAHDIQVRLNDCSEFIGVAQIPLARVQPLVPPPFLIAEGPPGFASLVVRASLCRAASMDGSPPEPVRVGQVGVVLVPPDGTGDINNYTLLYATDNRRLALGLEVAGLPVLFDPDLVYEVTPDPPGAGGELFVDASPLTSPAWFLSGTVNDPPPGPAFPFVANWWFRTRSGRLEMSTSIPLLSYGSGSVQVYTRRNSLLGGLIGGNTSLFGVNLRGVFAKAVMSVTAP